MFQIYFTFVVKATLLVIKEETIKDLIQEMFMTAFIVFLLKVKPKTVCWKQPKTIPLEF